MNELDPYATGGVNRLAGPDRAGTAARLAWVFWPQSAGTVYLATGQQYPDALASVPAAGTDNAPLLLTRQGCLPAATAAQLDRLQPQTVVIVGGPAAVSDQALSTPCTAAAPAVPG
ncbi:MAG: cell wall-binding repeat-containing protein [Frankiaceae bacterium]|nr:cell wall-binding repeat-containing protein [Frankiaceae bacterium]